MPNSTAPSRERHNHSHLAPPQVDDRHFRQFWRAVDPLDRLVECKLITAVDKIAATRFRAIYDVAFRGTLQAQDLSALRSGRRSGPALVTMAERQREGLAELKRVRERIGVRRFDLLVLVAVDELHWAGLAKQRRLDVRTLKKRAAEAIKLLAAL